MKFENGMICGKFVDDGNWTIGYVDGLPAQWDGNAELTEGEDFRPSSDGDTFGVNSQDEYIVEDGKWIENRKQQKSPPTIMAGGLYIFTTN